MPFKSAEGKDVVRFLNLGGIAAGHQEYGMAYNLAYASTDPIFGMRCGLAEDFPQVAAAIEREYSWVKFGGYEFWIRKDNPARKFASPDIGTH